MSTDLSPRLDHLAPHRRTIVVRSLATGLAGSVPVPLLDDWLAALIRRRAVRRLADARRVDLSEGAVRAVAEGRVPPPDLKSIFKGTALSLLVRRAWRRALLLLALIRRADETGRTFAVLTLFDHYCARVHVGGELQVDEARRLRDAIDRAVARGRGGLSGRILRRSVAGMGRAVARAPMEIVYAATGGRLRKLLDREDETQAEEIVDEALERSVAEEGGFLARATRAVELELAAAGGAWQAELVHEFERAWASTEQET
jgi:hypothetical protein